MTDEKRYQVFVSSTAEDLRDERQKIWEALVSLDFIVSGMEAFPATNDTQFQFIKQQIEQSDYYVLIIAGRYGSITEEGVSYTEREFDFAQSLKIPILVFPIRQINAVPTGKTDQDTDKRNKLEIFRNKASQNRLCSYWDSADSLTLMVVKSLQTAIKANPRPGWQRGSQTSAAELLAELHQLRIENDHLKAASQSQLTGKSSSELEQALRKAYSFNYYMAEDRQKYFSIQLSLKSILLEMSIFESPQFELFEDCLRGAITARTENEYEIVRVDRSETDRVILLLANAGVVNIERTSLGLAMRQGDYWIGAHSEAKLVR